MNRFSEKKEIGECLKISNELCDIAAASSLLSWDQETQMPPKGAGVRANQLSTLAGIYHERLTRTTVGKALISAEKISGLNEYDEALIREMRREYDRSTKIPTGLVRQISEATSRSFDAWQKAKKQSSWNLFSGSLEKLLELKVTAANLLKNSGQTVYDAMLDDHEENLTESDVDKVFIPIKKKISELAEKLSMVTRGKDTILRELDIDRERGVSEAKKIVTLVGFDWEGGRQDASAHPFEVSLGIGDVRMTTWKENQSLGEMILAAIHEAGHGLYEQGVDDALDRTHLAGGQGYVVHESQSRLWENMIGRSQDFWSFYYPKLRLGIKELTNVNLMDFIKGLNVVKPSLIRVGADEVTYGLHIILRYEIERELTSGKIKIKDLPEIWNRKMQELIGIKPNNDAEGILQDVHWSHGSFGYFPTYLLGTMAAAQLWNTCSKELDLKVELNNGNLLTIRNWLRNKVHVFGKVFTAKRLIQKVTGEDLNSKYYFEYLENKFKELYNL